MTEKPELPLLPNEPRVLDPLGQQALSERFLLPRRQEIEILMRGLRAGLDAELAHAQPRKWGKPYPLGQCLEIALAAKRALRHLNPINLRDSSAAQGHAALAAFLRHGGQMHQVWGDLRGLYFQNAFLAGTLYIDVANDTVDPAKPPVEILPLADSGLEALRDYHHYARIARNYWQAELYPNHLLPSLAPYYPLISVIPEGGIRLEADSAYMVLQAQRQGFASSAEILLQPPIDRRLYARLHLAVSHLQLQQAANAEQGRDLALAACRAAAAKGPALADTERAALGAAISQINRCWFSLG